MQIATYDAICHVHPQGICNIPVYIRVQSKIASMINPFLAPFQYFFSQQRGEAQGSNPSDPTKHNFALFCRNGHIPGICQTIGYC
jgi:hypothetical protein